MQGLVNIRSKRILGLAIEVLIAIAIVGLVVAYALSPYRLGISRNWGAFAGVTVILFINLFRFARSLPQTAALRWALVACLALHLCLGVAVCYLVEDIPLVWFALGGFAEIVVMLSIIQRLNRPPARE